jgi:hypothetical protein
MRAYLHIKLKRTFSWLKKNHQLQSNKNIYKSGAEMHCEDFLFGKIAGKSMASAVLIAGKCYLSLQKEPK